MVCGRYAHEDVRIFRADRPNPPTPTTYGRVLVLVAQGTKRFALGDALYEYHAGQYLIASVDLPAHARTNRRLCGKPREAG